MRLFTTAFLQVFLVSIQTIFLVRYLYIPIFITAFFISFLWTFNVKKTAFGSMKSRLIYSFGASLGAICGILFNKLF